jgi:hypothetical protein
MIWIIITIILWIWLAPLILFFTKGTFKYSVNFWHFLSLCLILSIPMYNWKLLNKITVHDGEFKETDRPKY